MSTQPKEEAAQREAAQREAAQREAAPAYQHYVGVDISKDTLDVCLLTGKAESVEKAVYQVENAPEGHRALIEWLASQGAQPETTIVCMEHTGYWADHLLENLTLSGWACAVEKTTLIKKVGPEHHRKEDDFDAALIAEYAFRFTDRLTLYEASHPAIEEIRLLYNERRRLVTQRASVKQLQGAAPRRSADTSFAEELWQEQADVYTEMIERLEERIAELIERDQDLHRRFEQVASVPGFGETMATLWVSLFFGEERLNARQIASRFGFAPHARRSGTSRRSKGRSTGHGDTEVRKMMTLCARSAAAHYEKFSAYKKRKLEEGKPKMLINNNLRNKLIRIVCAMWNQDAFYDPNHVSRFAKEAA